MALLEDEHVCQQEGLSLKGWRTASACRNIACES